MKEVREESNTYPNLEELKNQDLQQPAPILYQTQPQIQPQIQPQVQSQIQPRIQPQIQPQTQPQIYPKIQQSQNQNIDLSVINKQNYREINVPKVEKVVYVNTIQQTEVKNQEVNCVYCKDTRLINNQRCRYCSRRNYNNNQCCTPEALACGACLGCAAGTTALLCLRRCIIF